MRTWPAITLTSAALLTAFAVPALAVTPGVSVYDFAPEGLASAANSALPGSVATDLGIRLGGFGSDLYRQPGTLGEYWVVTDRGPNNDTVAAGGVAGTGFPVADFSPMIMKIAVKGSTASITERIAIQSVKGIGVTGLPNVPTVDGIATTVSGATGKYNPNGLDTEGIVRTKSGDFWLVDEYGPSVILVGSDGVVKKRYVPETWKGVDAGYPISPTLPGIYSTRKVNRGFEAVALTPSEDYLYVGLQSPLLNPDKKTGDASMQTRILRMNTKTGAVDGEWVYVFESVSSIDPTTTKTTDLKLSAMVALDDSRLLVQERTDNAFIVGLVNLSAGQSILGSAYDSTATSPSLEALKPTDSTLAGFLPFKEIVFRSSSVPEMPGKVEGMAVENANTLAFINDNDFSFSYDAKSAKVTPGSVSNRFLYVTLAQNLPTTPDRTLAALNAEKRATAKAAARR